MGAPSQSDREEPPCVPQCRGQVVVQEVGERHEGLDKERAVVLPLLEQRVLRCQEEEGIGDGVRSADEEDNVVPR